MAGKGKSKLNKDEIGFQDKRIHVKRFAYDVIKYTTVKFGLPEDSIPAWEGSDNDYGCDDFCLVVSREIISNQIMNRYQYLESFDKRHKLKRLASFDLVGRLLQDVMYDEMAGPLYDILDTVEISLSVLGELVLYIYAKDIDLYLQQLIDFWFDCHLNIKKKSFEAAGGLTELYARNSKPKFDRYDHFHDLFIKNYCLPYKDTASNPGIMAMYSRSYGSRIQKNAESLPPKGSKDIKKELMRGGEVVMRQRKGYKQAFKIEQEAVPEPVRTAEIDADENSGVKLSENTLLGISEHQEFYLVNDPPGTPPRKLVLPDELVYGRRLSTKKQMQMKKAGGRPNLEESLGQLSLDSSKPKTSVKKRAT